MRIFLGNEDRLSSHHYYTCEGCRDSVKVSLDGSESYDHSDVRQIMLSIGWRVRKFHESVQAWFCSHNCAHNSYNARKWEEYWKDK